MDIVQVVPAASYVIAMANKPKAQSLASTLPGEPMIGENGNRGAQPRSPHVVANVVADHSVLSVPDASSFEPDTVTSEDITDVHWPAPPAKTQAPALRKHKFAGRAEKRTERIAAADKNERRAEHAHRHKRTHTSVDGQHKKRRNAANDTNL